MTPAGDRFHRVLQARPIGEGLLINLAGGQHGGELFMSSETSWVSAMTMAMAIRPSKFHENARKANIVSSAPVRAMGACQRKFAASRGAIQFRPAGGDDKDWTARNTAPGPFSSSQRTQIISAARPAAGTYHQDQRNIRATEAPRSSWKAFKSWSFFA